MVNEFEKAADDSERDMKEIGQIIVNKMLSVFVSEINEYIMSIPEEEKLNIKIYKSIVMGDFISENIYLNILFNISKKYNIRPSSIYKDGLNFLENIKTFEEERDVKPN
jgi:hypothetical protein